MTEKKADYKTINLEALAHDLLDWAKHRRYMDELEAHIKDTVLALGETVVVGYARATYNNPRKSYDYEDAVVVAYSDSEDPEIEACIGKHTTTKTVTSTDWRAICKELNLEDVPYREGEARVTLKLDGAPPGPPAYDEMAF